jgi:putative copper resistance protein D
VILAGLIAARFTHYTALLLLLGAAGFKLFARAEVGPGSAVQAPHPPLHRILLWSSLATLLTGLAVLAMTAANLAGGLGAMADAAVLQTILLDTLFGQVWALRLALAAALAAALALGWTRGGSSAQAVLLALLAGALTISVALTGHAQIRTGLAGWTHRLVDAAHLAAAAVWLGALPPLLWLITSARAGDGALRAGRLLQRFHGLGALAVGTLLVSGLVNSVFLVSGPRALVLTSYGQVLCVKLALFAAMAALAADNRLRLVPGLNAALAAGLPPEAWLARLRARVTGEFVLGLGVLLAVAVLGVLAPANSG